MKERKKERKYNKNAYQEENGRNSQCPNDVKGDISIINCILVNDRHSLNNNKNKWKEIKKRNKG